MYVARGTPPSLTAHCPCSRYNVQCAYPLQVPPSVAALERTHAQLQRVRKSQQGVATAAVAVAASSIEDIIKKQEEATIVEASPAAPEAETATAKSAAAVTKDENRLGSKRLVDRQGLPVQLSVLHNQHLDNENNNADNVVDENVVGDGDREEDGEKRHLQTTCAHGQSFSVASELFPIAEGCYIAGETFSGGEPVYMSTSSTIVLAVQLTDAVDSDVSFEFVFFVFVGGRTNGK